jgi:hypothetical protein
VEPKKFLKAEEVEKLSPAEVDALFLAGIEADLDRVPPEFLAKARRRLEERLALAAPIIAVVPLEYPLDMTTKTWTAEELSKLTPAQQDELFRASEVTDLDQVPPIFLDRVRARLEERISKQESVQSE